MVYVTVYSQIGIQTETPHPSAGLELGSPDKTLFLNRVSDPVNSIADPQPGMILYDTTMKCVRVYQGDHPAWSLCIGLGLLGSEGSIESFDCASAAFNPATATQDALYEGTLSIPYTGGNGGTYPEDSFEVSGFTFFLAEGNYETGDGMLVYQVSGVPDTSGTVSADIFQNGASCTGAGALVVVPCEALIQPVIWSADGTGLTPTISDVTIIAAAENTVAGAGATVTASGGSSGYYNVGDISTSTTSHAQAVAANDYIEYGFTTAVFPSGADIKLNGVGMYRHASSGTYRFSVVISDDNFATSTVIASDLTVTNGTAGAQNYPNISNIMLEPGKTYKTRVYFYSSSQTTIRFDNFNPRLTSCDGD